jgi:hypothetical protein
MIVQLKRGKPSQNQATTRKLFFTLLRRRPEFESQAAHHFFATIFSLPFEDQSGACGNGTSFGLNDLEALVTVADQAKEWS